VPNCEVTVGKKQTKRGEWPYCGTIDTLKSMGAKIVEKDVDEIHVDKKLKLVSTPAFMKNASFFEVFNGIGLMIDEIIKLSNN
jgi:enhancing lycopene biosynthesis protein 2